jgi:hypothetical protein
MAIANVLAVPAYAAGGSGSSGASGGGAVGGVAGASVRTFRMNAALFTGAAVSGLAQYRLDAGGAQMAVSFTNLAHVPAGTVLGIFLNGRQVGTVTTGVQGASIKVSGAALLGVPLSARVDLRHGTTVIASGGFTLGV